MFRTSSFSSTRFPARARRTLFALLLNSSLCFALAVVAIAQDASLPSATTTPDRARIERRQAARRALRNLERSPQRTSEIHEPRARRLARTLDLTAEQRRQLGEIRRRNRIERRLLIANLRRAERELDNQIYADDIDANQIDIRVRRVSDAQSELTRLRANVELELRRVLTAEQLQRLRTLRERARTPRRPPLDASRRQRSS